MSTLKGNRKTGSRSSGRDWGKNVLIPPTTAPTIKAVFTVEATASSGVLPLELAVSRLTLSVGLATPPPSVGLATPLGPATPFLPPPPLLVTPPLEPEVMSKMGRTTDVAAQRGMVQPL